MSKDQEIRDVTDKLDELLDELQGTVEALNGILVPPAPDKPDEDGKELAAP